MTRWLTSDHHFFHANIIRYANRPFTGLAEMHAELVGQWNAAIALDDEVYHLGDFAFYKKDPDGVQKIFKSLHGRKILIRGSHDKGMEDLPWERIHEPSGAYPAAHKIGDVALTHDGDEFMRHYGGANRGYPDWRGKPVFCGHVHEIWKFKNNMLNVGVDVWHFRPVQWYHALAYWQERYDYGLRGVS